MSEVEQFADTVQHAFDRAGARQVQLDPVLVLHHPHRQLEQLQDDRHRLRPGQLGMAQRVLTQAVDQAVGGAGLYSLLQGIIIIKSANLNLARIYLSLTWLGASRFLSSRPYTV